MADINDLNHDNSDKMPGQSYILNVLLAEGVLSFPNRDAITGKINGTQITIDTGYDWHKLKCLRGSVKIDDNSTGEEGTLSTDTKLSGFYAGTPQEAIDWFDNIKNREVYIRTLDCATGLERIIGDRCNTAMISNLQISSGETKGGKRGITFEFTAYAPKAAAYYDPGV